MYSILKALLYYSLSFVIRGCISLFACIETLIAKMTRWRLDCTPMKCTTSSNNNSTEEEKKKKDEQDPGALSWLIPVFHTIQYLSDDIQEYVLYLLYLSIVYTNIHTLCMLVFVHIYKVN